MIIARVLQANRKLLSLGLLGLLPLVSGCGDEDKNTKPPAPATSQAQQDAERAAREKAFGKATIETGKNAPKPAEKPAEKSATKPAEK